MEYGCWLMSIESFKGLESDSLFQLVLLVVGTWMETTSIRLMGKTTGTKEKFQSLLQV